MSTQQQIDNARTDAVLAIERAMPEADRERILARFRGGNLDGAAVADILDILDNHDAMLEFTEPFYEVDHDGDVWRTLGWPAPTEAADLHTYDHLLRRLLVGYAALAVALLTDQVPEPGPVAELAGAAHATTQEATR